MVHPASANTTNGDTGNSDGNSESGDESHEALDEAEADDKQKEQGLLNYFLFTFINFQIFAEMLYDHWIAQLMT